MIGWLPWALPQDTIESGILTFLSTFQLRGIFGGLFSNLGLLHRQRLKAKEKRLNYLTAILLAVQASFRQIKCLDDTTDHVLWQVLTVLRMSES